MGRRYKLLGSGIALGALLAICVAGLMMPSSMNFRDRAFWGAAVMGGPLLGSIWNMTTMGMAIVLGWIGLLLLPAHPLNPNWATGLLTVAGLVLWYFVGFITVLEAVWGG